ncbi:tartrate dehydrogenase [Psychrobacillus sp.]|uniref:tartrate dehydrogenase n=1 Tax=Psychrobacillus sp. TaxID=1871623 RepID=UPI0028BE6CA3|nr:tartrate dehydrogenase [Psychrobacillus sp.]
MKTYKIATIPGDGIGKEVVPEAMRVLDTLAELDGNLKFEWGILPWGCDYYLENGEMMPEDGLEILKNYDQIFLGSVGMPELVPDHISLWGLLIKIRRGLQQSINIRPAKLLKGLDSPLKNPGEFDIIVVRENSEGEYSDSGGRMHSGQDEIAIQNAVFTRKGTERAMRYACDLSSQRSKKVTSATKSNGLTHSMPFWDDVFHDVVAEYPQLQQNSVHVDAMAAYMIMKPSEFDVIVASNLFGDILTDIGGAIMGSIGIAPAANLNVSNEFPSMFEPVHGSAPDIAGLGVANPLGQIWTGKLMLDYLGYTELGEHLLNAIEYSLEQGIKTGDLKGKATTKEVTDTIIHYLKTKAM